MLDEIAKSHIIKTIDNIIEEFGPDYVSEFVELSSNDITQRLNNLENYFKNRNMDDFRIAAHSFISLCGNIGLLNTATLSKELEQCCNNNDFGKIPSLFETFKSTLQKELKFCENYINSYAQ